MCRRVLRTAWVERHVCGREDEGNRADKDAAQGLRTERHRVFIRGTCALCDQ